MKFTINPFVGAGPIKFGMTRDDVRFKLDSKFESFKRTPSSALPCDSFGILSLFVYYKLPGNVEAIEFSETADISFKSKSLLSLNFHELKSYLEQCDENILVESDGLISNDLGISAYIPNLYEGQSAQVESILVFEKGYYN